MRWLVAAIALLALSACDKKGADGYAFDQCENDWPKDLAVSFVEHPSLADLRLSAPPETRLAVKHANAELHGWSAISLARKTCVIHVVDPMVRYAPEWEGHERLHCKCGRWHK